jgi:hypothetical protein
MAQHPLTQRWRGLAFKCRFFPHPRHPSPHPTPPHPTPPHPTPSFFTDAYDLYTVGLISQMIAYARFPSESLAAAEGPTWPPEGGVGTPHEGD